jgi:tRNA(Ile)-lysidine synthase
MASDHPASSLQIHLQAAYAREGAAPLLVALSGGLDSSALLHALAALPAVRAAGLRAVHVHHGLQPQADAWAAHCRQACDALKVRLDVVRTVVDRSARRRDRTRRARADPLRRPRTHARFRGGAGDRAPSPGPGGDLPAARAARLRPRWPRHHATWRRFGAGRHWRPLLEVPRAELLGYATAHGLRWIEDPSNREDGPDRNFLRLRVMPLLRQRWAHADAALARSAGLSAEASALLETEDRCALAAARPRPIRMCFPAAALRALEAPRRAAGAAALDRAARLSPAAGQGIERIARDLLPARSDARARFEWSGVVIERWRDLLHRRPAARGARSRLACGLGRCPRAASARRRPARAAERGRAALARTGARTGAAASASALPAGPIPTRSSTCCRSCTSRRGGAFACRWCPLSKAKYWRPGDLAYAAPLEAWLRERGARLRWTDGA